MYISLYSLQYDFVSLHVIPSLIANGGQESENTSKATMSDLLMFMTGSRVLSSSTVERKITVAYHHNPQAQMPKASTCFFKVTLPTCHETYEEFQLKFDKAIELEGNGFMQL